MQAKPRQAYNRKLLNGNLNKFLLLQLEIAGSEIEIRKTESRCYRARKKNPLVRLFEDRKLTRKEFVAGNIYQNRYELSQKTNHARPSYDGTPISAASSKSRDNMPSPAQLRAMQYCEERRMFVVQEFGPGAIKILEFIFEKEISALKCEKLLKANRRTIERDIKIICKILLDF